MTALVSVCAAGTMWTPPTFNYSSTPVKWINFPVLTPPPPPPPQCNPFHPPVQFMYLYFQQDCTFFTISLSKAHYIFLSKTSELPN